MSGSKCCFLTCIQIYQEAGNVVWYSHLFKNFPQLVIHPVEGFNVVNEVILLEGEFRKGKETRDQITICWIVEKPREFQKSIYFCFIDYAKAFDYVDHNKLWKILKVMGIPDHLTCLL